MSITLDSNKHAEFLAEGRTCPYTKTVFKPGDRIVFCRNCNSAHLESTWKVYGQCGGCSCSQTGPDILSAEEYIKSGQSVTSPLQTQQDTNRDTQNTQPSNNSSLYASLAAIAAVIIIIIIASTGNKQKPTQYVKPQAKTSPVYEYKKTYETNTNYNTTNTKINITDMCDDNNNTHIKIFDTTNNLVWPNGSESYNIQQYNHQYTINIACNNGANICYGARSSNNKYRWGADLDRSETRNLAQACFVCGQYQDYDINLGCSDTTTKAPRTDTVATNKNQIKKSVTIDKPRDVLRQTVKSYNTNDTSSKKDATAISRIENEKKPTQSIRNHEITVYFNGGGQFICSYPEIAGDRLYCDSDGRRIWLLLSQLDIDRTPLNF